MMDLLFAVAFCCRRLRCHRQRVARQSSVWPDSTLSQSTTLTMLQLL